METELKLALVPELVRPLRRLLAEKGTAARSRLRSTYYDTRDTLLLRHRMSLRLRSDGVNWVQTLKTRGAGGALARRGEWEIGAPRGRLMPKLFDDTPLR